MGVLGDEVQHPLAGGDVAQVELGEHEAGLHGVHVGVDEGRCHQEPRRLHDLRALGVDVGGDLADHAGGVDQHVDASVTVDLSPTEEPVHASRRLSKSARTPGSLRSSVSAWSACPGT